MLKKMFSSFIASVSDVRQLSPPRNMLSSAAYAIPEGRAERARASLYAVRGRFPALLFCLSALLLCLPAINSNTALAQDFFLGIDEEKDEDEMSPPPTLAFLQSLEADEDVFTDTGLEPDLDLRSEALKEAAFSLGARGGLARRTFEIRKILEVREPYLNQVYDFRQLLIPAPSGLLIEPPIISETMDNMLIDANGQQAAVADRIYNIGMNARIVSAARSWNQYLERTFADVDPPPQILRPKNKEERRKWKKWVREGWEIGIEQANEIFEADLMRLNADFEGMIRYRKLLAQEMVSPPFALENDRGVTGGGDLMRIGDRSVLLTGLPQLKPGYEEWRPASR